jgi:NAD dependent epimerase/dehydratase
MRTTRTAVVTGADGFIGSHLVERLIADGHRVKALCLYNSNGSLGCLDEIEGIRDRVDVMLGDIRDPEYVDGLIGDGDTVFHLAALIAIPHSYTSPRSFVDTNVSGTLNVLEAARRRQGVRVINTSTSEVYGTPETTPIRELHPIQPQSPYAATKVAADSLCRSYATSFNLDVLTLRPFNTYGPRQSMRAVIPTIMAQLLAGSGTVRLGSLHPRRDFTFVEDTVDGFIRIATAELEPGGTIQLGTGAAVSVGDLVKLCQEVTGLDAEVVTDDERVRPLASEVQVLLSDPRRARELLGWVPRVDLRSGLQAVADWLTDRTDPSFAARYHR